MMQRCSLKQRGLWALSRAGPRLVVRRALLDQRDQARALEPGQQLDQRDQAHALEPGQQLDQRDQAHALEPGQQLDQRDQAHALEPGQQLDQQIDRFRAVVSRNQDIKNRTAALTKPAKIPPGRVKSPQKTDWSAFLAGAFMGACVVKVAVESGTTIGLNIPGLLLNGLNGQKTLLRCVDCGDVAAYIESSGNRCVVCKVISGLPPKQPKPS